MMNNTEKQYIDATADFKNKEKLSLDWQTKAKYLFPNSTMLRTDSGPKHLTFLTKLQTLTRGGKKKDIVLYINNKNLVTKYYKTKC